jgi:hypothetical protein
MAELLVAGGIVFWLVLLAEIVLLFFLVENEHGIWATISLVSFIAALHFLFKIDVLAFVTNHFLAILVSAGIYFIIGSIWCMGKWWLYCKDQHNLYETNKIEWLKGKGIVNTKVIPENLKQTWTDFTRSRWNETWAIVPSVKENKSRILRWMSFWPTSIIWSLIDDFVRRIFNMIYYAIADYLQSIADKIYANTKDDFVKP